MFFAAHEATGGELRSGYGIRLYLCLSKERLVVFNRCNFAGQTRPVARARVDTPFEAYLNRLVRWNLSL
jgi:hypothetical protein